MSDPDTSDRLVVRVSRRRQLLPFLGSLVMVVGSLWLVGLFGPVDVWLPRWVHIAVGVAGLAFFGLGACYLGYGLIMSKVALVLSPEGLNDRASGSAAGLIPWSDITGTEVTAMGRQRILTVHVTDPEAVLARQRSLARGLMRQNAKLTGSVVTLPLGTLGISEERLVEEIERYRTAYG